MAKLRVLFIGGTGVISSACARVAVAQGIDLFVLNRGHSTDRPLPPGVTTLQADVREPRSVRSEIKDRRFDAVVDWVAFTPDQVRTDIELFGGRTAQYVFISSASAYQTPPARVPVTESTPLRNPFWAYSRGKIACEDVLAAADPDWGAGLLGDKAHSMIFDNAKVRALVPGWRAVIPFEQGAREIADWYLADPARQVTDATLDALMDKLAAAWSQR
jgi:nucleoside-diphosphate-sugar epimerase